ncbi:MAG: hypothetical protein JW889_04885 [Verrucomicrobia bacterium]|nr:hypothetical protein [Verrucomicrobiota bacterium]
MAETAQTRRVLGMRVRPRWPLGWPLFLTTLPSYLGFAMCGVGFRKASLGQGVVHDTFMLMAGPPVVWLIAALWLGLDLWILYRVRRAWWTDGEPARPLKLFFVWQVTKIAFCLVYPALVYAYFRP